MQTHPNESIETMKALLQEGVKSKSKMVSIKIPEDLLLVFRTKAKAEGRPYQSVMKDLMKKWALTES